MDVFDINDRGEMQRVIDKVHAKWEERGKDTSFLRSVAESLQSYHRMEAEIEADLRKITGDEKLKKRLTRHLVGVRRQRMRMLGLK